MHKSFKSSTSKETSPIKEITTRLFERLKTPNSKQESRLEIFISDLEHKKYLPQIYNFLKRYEPSTINISQIFLESSAKEINGIRIVLFFLKTGLEGIVTISAFGTVNCFFNPDLNLELLDLYSDKRWLTEFRNINIKMIMGQKNGVMFLEKAIYRLKGEPAFYFDYYTMKRKRFRPPYLSVASGYEFKHLKDTEEDRNLYLPLRTEYETEEVLPPGIKQNRETCLKHLPFILRKHNVLVLKQGNKIYSTATINAKGFKFWQIGGVYTPPEYRNQGFGEKIITKQMINILDNKKKVSLIVKTSNIPALKLYKKTGFTIVGYFRISYY